MKNKKILSLFLCLVMLVALFVPGATALADDDAGASEDNGMVLNKTATPNEDGTYTITLEAYATGSKIITEAKKDIPTDIILVLDQSGSMAYNFGTFTENSFISYGSRSNSANYNNRHNGGKNNLWYKLDDGSYASVSVERGNLYEESNTTNSYNNLLYKNRLYALVNGQYQQVTVDRSGNAIRGYTYTYKIGNTTIYTSDGADTVPDFTNASGIDDGVLYLLKQNDYQYIYSYTDAEGNRHVIGSSGGQNTIFETAFYQQRAAGSSYTRLEALVSALNSFTASVKEKAAGADGVLGTDDDVNHRIAVVGYADGPSSYSNTELFIGSTQYGYNNAKSQYENAFQSMNTQAGQDNVAAAIGALTASGSTYTQYGMRLANGILDANSVKENESRNRVVILFTDGYPGENTYDFDTGAADDAIKQAQIMMGNKVSVYSVGIFAGADATSEGNKAGTTTQRANWFMQNVSSNNGVPQNPSYYLSAADSASLNNIFQQISDNIETGGSSVTLGSEAVIKDIIAPSFTLPEGTTADKITLETYKCTGKDDNGYTWENNNDSMSATATVNGSDVNVTGFDFAGNYVGTVTENGKETYRGNKLVISFKVETIDGFLGGNQVPTNTSAGVYEDAEAENPMFTFPVPTVDVPIKYTFESQNQSIYLGNTADLEKLYVQDTKLDGENNAYVNIVYELRDTTNDNALLATMTIEAGQTTGTWVWEEGADKNPALTADNKYAISCTVTPTMDGTFESSTLSNQAPEVYVFKPEVTFNDSVIFLGETANYDDNTPDNNVTWKHNGEVADAGTMGPAPALSYTYSPVAGAFTEDTDVKVTVKIGDKDVTQYTSFVNKDDPNAKDHQFTVVVKSGTLTIKKNGNVDEEEGFIFNVYVGSELYTTVSVNGNGKVTLSGLPAGEYSVTEDTGWSWRYKEPTVTGPVTLSKDSDEGTITVTNTKGNNNWLGGEAYVHNVAQAVSTGDGN